MAIAIDARARGAAIRRARFRPTAERPPWAHSVLGTPPWSSAEGDRVVEELRAAIVSDLAAAPAAQGLVSAAPAIFRSKPASCSNIAF